MDEATKPELNEQERQAQEKHWMEQAVRDPEFRARAEQAMFSQQQAAPSAPPVDPVAQLEGQIASLEAEIPDINAPGVTAETYNAYLTKTQQVNKLRTDLLRAERQRDQEQLTAMRAESTLDKFVRARINERPEIKQLGEGYVRDMHRALGNLPAHIRSNAQLLAYAEAEFRDQWKARRPQAPRDVARNDQGQSGNRPPVGDLKLSDVEERVWRTHGFRNDEGGVDLDKVKDVKARTRGDEVTLPFEYVTNSSRKRK